MILQIAFFARKAFISDLRQLGNAMERSFGKVEHINKISSVDHCHPEGASVAQCGVLT